METPKEENRKDLWSYRGLLSYRRPRLGRANGPLRHSFAAHCMGSAGRRSRISGVVRHMVAHSSTPPRRPHTQVRDHWTLAIAQRRSVHAP